MITNEFIAYLLHGNKESFFGLNRMAADIWHPIPNTPYYQQTCLALKQIADWRLDLHWGYELEFAGAPNEQAVIFKDYMPNKFRKIIPHEKIMQNFFDSLKQKNYICRITTETEIHENMATKKPKNLNETGLITVPNEKAIDVFYAETKEKVRKALVNVTTITVIDTPEQAKDALEKTQTLDKIDKEIEAVRTTLKAPFLAAGRLIDERAKLVTAGVDVEIKRVKGLLLAYDKKQAEIAAQKAAEAEAQRKAAEQQAINETAQVHSSILFLEQKTASIYKMLAGAKSWDDIKKVFLSEFQPSVWETFAPNYAGFEKEANEVRQMILEFAQSIEPLHKAIAESADGSMERQKAYLDLAHTKQQFTVRSEQYFFAAKGTVEEKVEQVVLNAEVAKAEITAAVINSAPASMISKRNNLDFELVSIEALAAAKRWDLIQLNEAALRNILSTRAQDPNPKNLSVRDLIKEKIDESPTKEYHFIGIRFFYNESVSL
jgi:hypothetical protein